MCIYLRFLLFNKSKSVQINETLPGGRPGNTSFKHSADYVYVKGESTQLLM